MHQMRGGEGGDVEGGVSEGYIRGTFGLLEAGGPAPWMQVLTQGAGADLY